MSTSMLEQRGRLIACPQPLGSGDSNGMRSKGYLECSDHEALATWPCGSDDVSTQSLTPRGAVALGLVCIAAAAMPILGGLGLISVKPTPGTPGWVGVGAGLMFLFAGVTLLADAAAGGIGPDGQLPSNAPAGFHVVQSMMGLGIVALMAAISSWIAFGAGERHFSTTISIPFVAWRLGSADTLGRWAFGIAAVLLWCAIAVAVWVSLRRLVSRIRAVL